jgi:multicomponent Na+:H+ antiporter subunit A
MSEFNPGSIVFFPFMAAVIIILAAIFAIFTNSRLVAILALGIVGYGTGLLYMYYGAIDLSITQFLAETLIMMLFVMVVYKLPAFVTMSSRRSRSRDAFIGVASGILLTVMVIQSGFIQIDQPVSDYFLREAFPAALGKNVVNVILVDFRALDTLGEIIVLTLAAVGIYAMLKFKSSENEFRSF